MKTRFFKGATITDVLNPPKEVRGRGGGIRVKASGNLDITIVGAYYSPSQGSEGEPERSVKILSEWMETEVHKLAGRSMVFIGIYGNAAIGPSKEGENFATTRWYGAHNHAARMNTNGKRLMQLAEDLEMT